MGQGQAWIWVESGEDSLNGGRDEDKYGVVFMRCREGHAPDRLCGRMGWDQVWKLHNLPIVALCSPLQHSRYDWKDVIYQMNSIGYWVFPCFITHFITPLAIQGWPSVNQHSWSAQWMLCLWVDEIPAHKKSSLIFQIAWAMVVLVILKSGQQSLDLF